MNQYLGEPPFDESVYKRFDRFHINDPERYNAKEYYSWINKNFSQYKFPENYKDKTEAELCNIEEYSLNPQQRFAGRIFNTYVQNHGMIVYHGLGSGKTQTSIVIGEAFKYRSVNNQEIPGRANQMVYIVVPKSLIKQYYSEFIGKIGSRNDVASAQILIHGEPQIYIDENVVSNIAAVSTNLEKMKQEIESITLTLNKPPTQAQGRLAQMQKLQQQSQLNAKQVEFDKLTKHLTGISKINKVDRVYKLVTHTKFILDLFAGDDLSPDASFLKHPNTLLIIDEAHNLVSESGSSYKRLLQALSMYAHPDQRTVLMTGTPIYDRAYEFGLLMNLIRPRLYFPAGREEFDKVFVVDEKGTLEPNARLLFKTMCSGYISYFRGGNPNAYPRKKIIYMDHLMTGNQASVYDIVYADEKRHQEAKGKSGFGIFDQKDKEPITVFSASRCISNIAFLGESNDSIRDSTSTEKDEQYETFFKVVTGAQLVNGKKASIDYITSEHSVKLGTIATMIHSSTGTSFVYSNYRNRGGDIIGLLLKHFYGFEEYPKNRLNQPAYYLWNGSSDPDVSDRAQKRFNSLENKNGELIKVIIGSPSTMEGIDFKNVKNVHIVDPWWNFSRIEQITARAIRFCSHVKSDTKFVNIFYHTASTATSRDPENKLRIESIDKTMYKTAQNKMIKNHDFYKAIKEVAIDCDINKYGNIVVKDAIFRQKPGSNGKYSIAFSSGVEETAPEMNLSLTEIYDFKPKYPAVEPENIECSQKPYPYLSVPEEIRENSKKCTLFHRLLARKKLKEGLVKLINDRFPGRTPEQVKADIRKLQARLLPKITNDTVKKDAEKAITSALKSNDMRQLNTCLRQLKQLIKNYP